MRYSVTSITVKITYKDGNTTSFKAEALDMTIPECEVPDRFGKHIDSGDFDAFLSEFQCFDTVHPTLTNVSTALKLMGGMSFVDLITLSYRKTDPYGDGADSYFVTLKGTPAHPQAVLTQVESADSEPIFDDYQPTVCEGVLEIQYTNPVLSALLTQYDYHTILKSSASLTAWDGFAEYYGVDDLPSCTRTLIAVLLHAGRGKDGLKQALVNSFDRIISGFTFIEGTAEEESDEELSYGYDFSYADGVYSADSRECYNGW